MKQRFEKLRVLLSEKLTLYPILIGILFVTTELHKNWTISTSINKILFALIIICFCLVVNFFTRLLVKNKIKAAFVATLFIATNIYSQYFINWINELSDIHQSLKYFGIVHSGRYIFTLWGIICFVLIILILKTKKKLFSLNLYLNILIFLFLAHKICTIIFTEPLNVELTIPPNKQTVNLIEPIFKNKPNIYFIILDSYTSSESLKKYWNYDNSTFEEVLAKEGFFTTHSSRSDYDLTPYCMASYLNISTLNIYNKNSLVEGWSQQKNNLLTLIKNSILIEKITQSGYTFINYSIFEIGNTKGLYKSSVSKDSETLFTFFQPTILPAIIGKIQTIIDQDSEKPSLYPNLKVFKLLEDSIAGNKKVPTFVYAHLMMPHDPFEYDENGNRTSLQNRYSENSGSYLKQLKYTNTLVVRTIKKILASEKKRPIIIIQGDHGFRFLENVDYKIKRTEGHSIFSSYLFPDYLKVNLNDSISPIKAISLLFNDK